MAYLNSYYSKGILILIFCVISTTCGAQSIDLELLDICTGSLNQEVTHFRNIQAHQIAAIRYQGQVEFGEFEDKSTGNYVAIGEYVYGQGLSNVVQFQSENEELQLLDLEPYDQGYMIALNGFGRLKKDGNILYKNEGIDFIAILYMDMEHRLIRSEFIDLFGNYSLSKKIEINNLLIYLPISIEGFVRYDEKKEMIETPSLSGIFSINLMKNETQFVHIKNPGKLIITDHSFLHGRYYLLGMHVDTLLLDNRLMVNRGTDEDMFIAEFSNGRLINGFSLQGVLDCQAEYLVSTESQLILTGQFNRHIIPHPEATEVILSGLGSLISVYDEDLELLHHEVAEGSYITTGEPVSTLENTFIVPFTITESILMNGELLQLPDGALYRSVLAVFLANGDVDFIFGIPQETGNGMVTKMMREGEHFLMSYFFQGVLLNRESNAGDAAVFRLDERTYIEEEVAPISIYPNPISSSLFVQINSGTQILDIEVYSVHGKRIQKWKNVNEIQAPDIPGTYVICFMDMKGNHSYQLLVVQ